MFFKFLQIVQEKIQNMYSSYGIQPEICDCSEQRIISFADGSDIITVEIDQTKLHGYKVKGSVSPSQV